MPEVSPEDSAPVVADPRPIMRVESVSKHFRGTRESPFRRSADVRAVDNVSLQVGDGETVVLVGESGSGKSTLGRIFLRLIQADSGAVFFKEQDISREARRSLRTFHKSVQVIFQDPFSSLDPRMRVGAIIAEGLRLHRVVERSQELRRVLDLLSDVGLPPTSYDKYPHEFSGGQRQRVAIARALAFEPEMIVCDEPVSALDVLVQAQVLNLLHRLKDTYGLSLLFITHDLGVARVIADRIAVMHRGRLIEVEESEKFFAGPTQPYSRSLMSAVPTPQVRRRREKAIS